MREEKDLPEDIKIDVKPSCFLLCSRLIEVIETYKDPQKATEAIISILCVVKYSDMLKIDDEKTMNMIKGMAKTYEEMAKVL